MEVRLKNTRADSVFFDLKNVDDHPSMKITNLLTSGDIVSRPSNAGTMKLSIIAFEKEGIFSTGNEWIGFVPADTIEPINIGSDKSGSILVSFDETLIPNTIPSIWNSKMMLYGITGISVSVMIFLGYYIYIIRKKR